MSAQSTAPTTGRLAWLEPTKGVAMFMVVAYHVILYLQSAGVDAMLGRARAAFELFPLPAFFLSPGCSPRGRRSPFRALWRRRLLPILYLYVVFSVIRSLHLSRPGDGSASGRRRPLRSALPLILCGRVATGSSSRCSSSPCSAG